MCESYGDYLGTRGGQKFFSFPSLGSLVSRASEGALRGAGFGYRAGFVVRAVGEVKRRGGEVWLDSLRQQPYPSAWTELQELPGVGAKVSTECFFWYHTHTYMYTHTHTCIHTHTCTLYTCTCTCVHTHTCTYTLSHIHCCDGVICALF